MLRRTRTSIAAALACLALTSPAALAADGDLDPTFGEGGVATTLAESERARMALQPDGGIIVAGHNVGGDVNLHVHRLTASGQRDMTFGGGDGRFSALGGLVGPVAIQPDGKIVVSGTRHPDQLGDAILYRLTPEGVLDPTFGDGGRVQFDYGPDAAFSTVTAVALQADGRILVAGHGGHRFAAARLDPDGSFDESFSGDGLVLEDLPGDREEVAAIVLRGDRAILAGTSDRTASSGFAALALGPDGSRDETFGPDGTGLVTAYMGTPGFASDAVATPDGGLLLAGARAHEGGFQKALLKLDAPGREDAGFGSGGRRFLDLGGRASIAATADGGYAVSGSVVDGERHDYAVAKLTVSGALDPTFGDGGIGTYPGPVVSQDDLTLQPDGKLLLAVSGIPEGYVMAVARIQAPAPAPAPPPDDDGSTAPAVALPLMDITGGSGVEGGFVPFTVTLDQPSGSPVTVDFVTGDGTAERRLDYTGRRGTLTIPAGETSATIEIAALGDRLFEPDEQFRIELSNARGARLRRHVDTATIHDLLAPGRCQNVVAGRRGIDILTGTSAGDLIQGREDADVLFGLAGDDCVHGNRGADRIEGGDGADLVDGGPGDDSVDGGPGDDRVIGGRGRNRYQGGAGNDRLYARNGRSEIVDCGAGRDRVKADRSDRLRRCERIDRP
ncbi:MAG: hypothetical protein M3340_07875 [Actinomycetota bacterium]|nr:hypothetical protein [Actinomycetota bacterium]